MKKLLAIILLTTLLLSFTACSASQSVTLDDAKQILNDHQIISTTNDDGSIHAWITLHNGLTYVRESNDLISDLEEKFGIPSYDDLCDMCSTPNKSKQIECGNIKIEITSLPTTNRSKMISINFEEIDS